MDTQALYHTPDPVAPMSLHRNVQNKVAFKLKYKQV